MTLPGPAGHGSRNGWRWTGNDVVSMWKCRSSGTDRPTPLADGSWKREKNQSTESAESIYMNNKPIKILMVQNGTCTIKMNFKNLIKNFFIY